jgi:hypothetical protein
MKWKCAHGVEFDDGDANDKCISCHVVGQAFGAALRNHPEAVQDRVGLSHSCLINELDGCDPFSKQSPHMMNSLAPVLR